MADNRSNLWAFLIYPNDSAPSNYIEIIQSWHIEAALSPLHSPDPNGDPGETFKDHIHVILYFGTGQKKSLEQVKKYCDQLNGTRPFILDNRNGYVRYLIHYNNPEKTQYDESEILCLSGFDIGDAFNDRQSVDQYYDFVEEFISSNIICNFMVLIDRLKEQHLYHELNFVRQHVYYVDKLIDANYKKLKKTKKSFDSDK